MHRFFVSTELIAEHQAVLSGPVAHQVCRVLRMRPGERVVLLDDSGWEFETELEEVKPDRVKGRVLDKQLARGEPRTKISLYQGVLKATRFEFVLQKATELGVMEFIPLIATRTVVTRMDAVQKKRGRWERIICEAAEQSGRGRLPRLREPMLFSNACAHAQQKDGLSLLPWEKARFEDGLGLKDILKEAASLPINQSVGPEEDLTTKESKMIQYYGVRLVNLFIGPEGGFTREEAEMARRHTIYPVTLGNRVLRAETAAIAAVAVILHEMGDLG